MRFTCVFALACTFALTAPLASSHDASRDRLAVTLIDITSDATGSTFVSWSVATSAMRYDVYRGYDLDELELLAQTSSNWAFDHDPPSGDVWYVILSIDHSGSNIGGSRGACINHRGATGISIAVSHCLPTPHFM